MTARKLFSVSIPSELVAVTTSKMWPFIAINARNSRTSMSAASASPESSRRRNCTLLCSCGEFCR